MRDIIAKQHNRVTQILKEQLPALEQAAACLLSKETISGDELKAIASEHGRKAPSASDAATVGAASR